MMVYLPSVTKDRVGQFPNKERAYDESRSHADVVNGLADVLDRVYAWNVRPEPTINGRPTIPVRGRFRGSYLHRSKHTCNLSLIENGVY